MNAGQRAFSRLLVFVVFLIGIISMSLASLEFSLKVASSCLLGLIAMIAACEVSRTHEE